MSALKFRDLLRLHTEDEPLMRAQLSAMIRQVPWLYLILCTNVIALSLSFHGQAPDYLTVYFPAFFVGVILIRMVLWFRTAPKALTVEDVRKKLKMLLLLAAVLTFALSTWSWSLYPYGDANHQGYVSFFVAVTLIGSVFALVQYSAAAITCMIITGISFAFCSFLFADVVRIAMAMNFVMVLAMMYALIRVFQKAFAAQVHAHQNMERANAEMSNLNAQLTYHRDNLAEEVAKRTAELKSQALKLEQALSQEKELNQMQNRFVSMVSHEFRTPLTVIDGTARRVEKRAPEMPPGEIVDRMSSIRASVRRLSGLVERTLDASRLAEGAIDYAPAQINPVSLLQEIIDRHLEMEPGFTFDVNTEAAPSTMIGDPRLADHIVSNILSNAIKYSRENPRVDIVLKGQGDRIVLSVRDHGIGIPKRELDRVSERFFRATSAQGIPGTGIGLNLVRTLVDMHGGFMDISSEEGQWTEVRISLPVDGRTKLSPVSDVEPMLRSAGAY